jgi:hypothetical protein
MMTRRTEIVISMDHLLICKVSSALQNLHGCTVSSKIKFADISPELAKLLRRCLQKDGKLRLRHIGDACIELEAAVAAPATRANPKRISRS